MPCLHVVQLLTAAKYEWVYVSLSLHVCVCLPGPPPAPSTIEFRPEGAVHAADFPSGESCSCNSVYHI